MRPPRQSGTSLIRRYLFTFPKQETRLGTRYPGERVCYQAIPGVGPLACWPERVAAQVAGTSLVPPLLQAAALASAEDSMADMLCQTCNRRWRVGSWSCGSRWQPR